MPRPDAPGASASLRRLEKLLRRQQAAIRQRRPVMLLEVTEALEAEVSRWAAEDPGTAPASSRPPLSSADRQLLQRVRTLQQSNLALLQQEANWVRFMLAHLRPSLQTYSDDGRLTAGGGRLLIDRHA